MSSGLFKKQCHLQTTLFTNYEYLISLYKQDLVLNNLQELICHKTKPTNQLYKENKRENIGYLIKEV